MTFIETGRFEVRKTFGIRGLRARWNFWVQLCRKTALPGNETVMGVNFNTFLTFWAEMRRLRSFCLCVTGFEKLCTRYRPRDSVIACRPCLIIVLRATLARTPPNICDLASVLPVVTTPANKLSKLPLAVDGLRFEPGFSLGWYLIMFSYHDCFQKLLFNTDAVQNRQKGNGRQCDNPGIHWRRWSLSSAFSVNTRAVTLTAFPFQCMVV